MTSFLPLDGIRVLDLTQVLAGPLCTMMLGDAGADVIKIEPPGGDSSRRMGPPFWGGEGAEFLALNRNKRSIVLNLKDKGDLAIMHRLIATADVLVENYRTGVAERLGIGWEQVHEINPRLIYCSISGFGRSGPRAMEPAYDAIMQAFVGSMASTGSPGGEPVRANVSISDISAGMYANQGILLALRAREVTGEGQLVETSLFESQIAWLLYRAVGYFATGSAPARKLGSAAPHVVPYQAYQTADGYIIAGALNDGLFYKMARALDLDELCDDPKFRLNSDRVAHRSELNGIIGARFA
jgi:crotonobetainyl-CoA:carnitine CoA-transferase CaiB-like acyl-CoA transferase